MPLCSNRFPLPGSPSTCTLDIAIVPLPSFVFLPTFLLLSYGIIRLHNGPHHSQKPPYPTWIHYVYTVLVAAAFCMTILELGRLIAEKLGVGLLPFNTAGLLTVLFVLWRERRLRTFEMMRLLSGYWFFLTIVQIVYVVRLGTLMEKLPNTTRDSKYPTSDWWLDNLVLLILYIVFLLIELVTIFLTRRPKAEQVQLGGVH